MRDNLYRNTAKYYDGGNARSFSEDIAFYKKLITKGDRILDVGCGTGRVSLELAQEEVDIMAIDLSESMLEVFQEKLATQQSPLKGRIELKALDMTDFQLHQTYDLIIFPFRVFQALQTQEQRKACLQTIKRHATPNTRIILNMFDPNPLYLKDVSSMDKIDYQYFDETRQTHISRRTVGIKHDADKKIISSKYVFTEVGEQGETTVTEELLTLGYLEKTEWDELFRASGFDIVEVVAWWDGTPYREEVKKELIYTLQLSPSTPN